jgi:hypothetical protein
MTGIPATGLTDTLLQPVGPFPHELDGVTHMLPELLPMVTVIAELPCPEFSVQPAGTVQVYVVAFCTVIE